MYLKLNYQEMSLSQLSKQAFSQMKHSFKVSLHFSKAKESHEHQQIAGVVPLLKRSQGAWISSLPV